MMTHRFATTLAVVALALATTASQARAGLTSSATYDYSENASAGTTDVNVGRFDPTLGTLTGVRLDLSYATTGVTFNFINLAGPQSSSIYLQETILLNGPGVSESSGYQFLFPTQGVAFDANQTKTVSQTQAAAGSFGADVGPTYIASYVGSGTTVVNVFADGLETANGVPSPTIVDNKTGTTAGTLTVTYTFTPAAVTVPEPTTFASATIAALVGLGVARRRRTRPSA